ncbi:pentapeptide repeat-containing protein [Actinoplanes sp. NPDC048967]|uniref:pentapeptide repeat-containing protein n=1 Tax=Actinoplanes sp. NPDC048967 TaxID=3155269 RepID=UPI0033E492EE
MRALRQRWSTPDGRLLHREIQSRLAAGAGLDDLDLAEVDGKRDLRGFPAAAAVTQWRGAHLAGIDLSGASLAGVRLFDCTLESVRLDRAVCHDWRLWGSTVADTTFTGAELRGSSLGAWREGRGNRYKRVSFVRADLTAVGSSAATYTDCDFSFARLDRVNFWQSSLVRCTFAGPLRDVVFDGRHLGEDKPDTNPMTEVDLSRAEFDGCEFRGTPFTTVRLPADPDLMMITDVAQADRALAALSPADGTLPGTILQHARKLLGMGSAALLNARDFPAGAPAVRAALTATGWRPGGPAAVAAD